jgi:hypothetical protein
MIAVHMKIRGLVSAKSMVTESLHEKLVDKIRAGRNEICSSIRLGVKKENNTFRVFAAEGAPEDAVIDVRTELTRPEEESEAEITCGFATSGFELRVGNDFSIAFTDDDASDFMSAIKNLFEVLLSWSPLVKHYMKDLRNAEREWEDLGD